jgi:hypothetical protein
MKYLSRLKSSESETKNTLYRWRLTLTADIETQGSFMTHCRSGHTYSCKIWIEYLSRLKSSGPETKNTLYRWRLTLTCDLHVWCRNTGFIHDTPSSGHTYSCKIWTEYLSLLKSSGPETKKWDGRMHAHTDRLKPVYPPYTMFRVA